jgi:hypothetical protein
MNELHDLVIFPRGSSKKSIIYVLDKYFAMDSKKIKEILNTDSRYVVVSKCYPNYIMEEKRCYSGND